MESSLNSFWRPKRWKLRLTYFWGIVRRLEETMTLGKMGVGRERGRPNMGWAGSIKEATGLSYKTCAGKLRMGMVEIGSPKVRSCCSLSALHLWALPTLSPVSLLDSDISTTVTAGGGDDNN